MGGRQVSPTLNKALSGRKENFLNGKIFLTNCDKNALKALQTDSNEARQLP